MKISKKKALITVVIVALVAIAISVVMAMIILGREAPNSLIDYSAAVPKTTVSYAPAEMHTEADHAEEGRPQPVALHDLHLDKAMNFDPEKGEKGVITYTLKEPAMLTIRIVKEGTRELYLATIANLAYRDAGEHTETWDGRDYSGNVVDMTKACMIIQAVAASSYEPGKMELEKKSPEEVVHADHPWGHVHAHHHEYAEEVPILKIMNIHKGDILSGKVWIKAEVDKDKRGYGNQYGYGVRYYVDNTLAHEEFYKPKCDYFAYELDTTAFEDGKHMLYVGMCDHQEHTTSAGVPIVFDNSGAK